LGGGARSGQQRWEMEEAGGQGCLAVVPVLPTATPSRLPQFLPLSTHFHSRHEKPDLAKQGLRKSRLTGGASAAKYSVWVSDGFV